MYVFQNDMGGMGVGRVEGCLLFVCYLFDTFLVKSNVNLPCYIVYTIYKM